MGRPKVFRKANKKSTKGKGKQWKKGQSSSFNPSFKKHRLEAKKKAIFGNQGSANLTEAKIALHNKLSNEAIKDEELASIGGGTAMSAFTNCSLPAFTRLLQNWQASSVLHKEMLAVLAAVTEVLKSRDGKETETEYFAALMTTLGIVSSDEEITAVICLLSMVVKRLNENVLKLHMKTAIETFMKLLVKFMNSDYSALLKNLLDIIFQFLKVKTVWTDSSSDELDILLEFTTHHKPKVRKEAQHIIYLLLTHTEQARAGFHPGAAIVANFCIQKMQSHGGSEKSQVTFYVLSLLQNVISALPKSSIKSCCETIFKLMTLSTALVISYSLKVLRCLFAASPREENLPSDLNARIISALYDYQPNINDGNVVTDWLEVMENAFLNLYKHDKKLCMNHLLKFFSVAVKCWQSNKDFVFPSVASTLKSLLRNCINCTDEVYQQLLLSDPVTNPMFRIFKSVEEALSYQYNRAWKYVLDVLTTCFEVMGKHCYTVMLKCLKSLADMHDTYQFPYIVELEKAIGVAVRHMGPRIVLQAIPLQINVESDKPDFPQSWLLPLFRDYIKNTELDFFIKYFLPLAGKLRNKVRLLQQDKKFVESKLYDVVCSQVWSLLPNFCTEPTDLVQSFKEIARILGMILKDEADLRMTVLSSLRTLIAKNLDSEENKVELAKYAKNYIPILFTLYTIETKDKTGERIRLAVYDTCKVYLQIADEELCSTFFTSSMEKLRNKPEIFVQQALIDLNKAMLPYVNESHIATFYEYCVPLLKHSNRTIQKKCYGVMNELCCGRSDSCLSFVNSHLEELRSLLCGTVMNLFPATRALRLSCLQHIINRLPEEQKDFVSAIVPEAVLCTKENSTKARAAAYNLLIEIGNTLKRWKCDDKGALRDYMALLLAGLASSPHMMSASILAIGSVIYEFKDDLESDVIHLLIENVCLLLTSRSREVVVASISFLKVLFVTIDTLDLAQHVEYMVHSLTNIAEDHQRNLRFKAKEIFTRLIRKFGYEMISKMVPDKFQKQLTNIRKLEARKKRRKEVTYDIDDDYEECAEVKTHTTMEGILEETDDEVLSDVEPTNPKHKAKRSKTSNDPWIEEHDESDIVDFLDPSVSKKILAMKPVKAVAKPKVVASFPVSEDGRIIIKDDEEENETMSMGGIGKSSDSSVTPKNSKRKLEVESDDEDITPEPQFVNKGIHRTIGKLPGKKKMPGEEYKAKKAGGDVKKGKYDPYAYLPLNRQVLNRRKQVKLKGQFKNIVKAAKRGASIGVKRKTRQAKRKMTVKKNCT